MFINIFIILAFLLCFINFLFKKRIKLIYASLIFIICYKIFLSSKSAVYTETIDVNTLLFLVLATIILLFIFHKFIEDKK